jgi:hypothetical protein
MQRKRYSEKDKGLEGYDDMGKQVRYVMLYRLRAYFSNMSLGFSSRACTQNHQGSR